MEESITSQYLEFFSFLSGLFYHYSFTPLLFHLAYDNFFALKASFQAVL